MCGVSYSYYLLLCFIVLLTSQERNAVVSEWSAVLGHTVESQSYLNFLQLQPFLYNDSFESNINQKN